MRYTQHIQNEQQQKIEIQTRFFRSMHWCFYFFIRCACIIFVIVDIAVRQTDFYATADDVV